MANALVNSSYSTRQYSIINIQYVNSQININKHWSMLINH